MLNIVHVVNQFFAGLGGEEKADTPVGILDGPSAVGRALQSQLGKQAQITATLYVGDNYFHEHKEEAREAVLCELRARKPQLIIAGPAFNSGRYGLACVEICSAIAATCWLRPSICCPPGSALRWPSEPGHTPIPAMPCVRGCW